jgi:hypothetical protein
MRRSINIILSATCAVALSASTAGAVSARGHTSGSPESADLAVSGAVAGGARTLEYGHLAVFVFTLRNRGPAAIVDNSADIGYTAVRNGTVVDQYCINTSGSSFNPDSPACEFGDLAPGEHTRMVVIVQPDNVASAHVRVRVCASNEAGVPDDFPGNDCVTRSVLV